MFARGWGEGKVSRAITPTELMSEYKKKIKKSSRLKSTFLLTDGVSVPCVIIVFFFFVFCFQILIIVSFLAVLE